MAFTKKIAGWVAGRIKGEQARKDTMRWMEKTGLGQILDIAGDIALTQGAIKGVSGLKGLMMGQKALPALPTGQASTTLAPRTAGAITPPSAPAAAIRPTPVPAAAQAAAPAAAPAATAFQPSAAGRMASQAVRGMTPPAPSPMQAMVAPPAAPVGGGMTPQMAGTAQRMGGLQNVANANVAGGPGGLRGIAQFGRENASWLGPAATATSNVIGKRMEMSLEEEQMKREQDAKNRMAMLLMPMFQQQLGQYTQQYGTPFSPSLPGGR